VPVNVIDEPAQILVAPEIAQAVLLITSALENVPTNSKAQTKNRVNKELWIFRIRRQSKLIFRSVSIPG
jgi:hypothetical protein